MVNKFNHRISHDPLFTLSLLAWLGIPVFPGLLIIFPFSVDYHCPFKSLTGLPCPTCGTTRMLQALTRLNPGKAFFYQPLGFLTLLGLLAYFPISFFFSSQSKFPFPAPRTFLACFIFLTLINWGYLIVLGI